MTPETCITGFLHPNEKRPTARERYYRISSVRLLLCVVRKTCAPTSLMPPTNGRYDRKSERQPNAFNCHQHSHSPLIVPFGPYPFYGRFTNERNVFGKYPTASRVTHRIIQMAFVETTDDNCCFWVPIVTSWTSEGSLPIPFSLTHTHAHILIKNSTKIFRIENEMQMKPQHIQQIPNISLPNSTNKQK